jgi:hypothetical protein
MRARCSVLQKDWETMACLAAHCLALTRGQLAQRPILVPLIVPRVSSQPYGEQEVQVPPQTTQQPASWWGLLVQSWASSAQEPMKLTGALGSWAATWHTALTPFKT